MISERIRGLNSLFLFTQLTLVLLIYWLHFLIVDSFFWTMADIQHYEIYCIVVYVTLLMDSLRRLNSDINLLRRDRMLHHRAALQQGLMVATVLVVFVVIRKDQSISRLFLFSFIPVLYLTLFASSYHLPHWLADLTFRGSRRERTVLMGPVAKAAALRPWLQRKEDLGIVTVGLLTDEEGARGPDGLRVLGTWDDLETAVRQHGVTQVILVELPMFPYVMQSLTNICEQLGVRLLVLSDLEIKFRHPVTYFEDDGHMFVSLRDEPLENPFNRSLKRTLDLTVALPVVVFLLPLTSLLVWLFQRLQSPGPVFHIQPRAGFQNRHFNMVKYRTMHVNLDQSRQATRDDPRIYPAARYFRKFSFDELPQFWNVLRGEMSVVGPRPHLVEHNDEFASVMRNYHVRAFVKPGITGLAQVSGFRGETRSEAELVKRIELDIRYLETWSLTGDIFIIFMTLWTVIRPPETAY